MFNLFNKQIFDANEKAVNGGSEFICVAVPFYPIFIRYKLNQTKNANYDEKVSF